jgi:hypothetical protein
LILKSVDTRRLIPGVRACPKALPGAVLPRVKPVRSCRHPPIASLGWHPDQEGELRLRRQPLACTGVAVTVQIAAIAGFLVDDHIRGADKLLTGNGGN